MGVRFIIGRAGSGKTHYCLEQIARRLRESAGEGQHLFLLVPEQASLQMERAILERPGIQGFARCEVLSFRRLAYRVFNACGGVLRTIRPIARLMVLRHLVVEMARDLRVFGSRSGRLGTIGAIERTIDELIREDVTPDDLARLLSEIEGQDDLLSARLHDIHRLYRGYLDRLGSDMADPGHCLRIVRERLAAYTPLAGSLIWADGFAGLTRQEQALLVALAGMAEQVEVSLLIDPSSPVVSEGAAVEPFHLFARTERTYARLARALHEAGISPAPPLILHGDSGRFSASPTLARLERSLFAAIPPAHAAGGTSEGRANGNTDAVTSERPASAETCGDEIQLVQAATRRVEVAAVVAEIQRLVRRPGCTMRYRDIAIIVRDLGPYHDVLSAALGAAGIPFFIDRRRPIGHHALVELVRSTIELAIRVDIETVATFIKTGLTGLEDDQADLLENFVRAHAVTGREPYLQSADWLPRPRPSQRRGEDDPAAGAERDLEAINRARRYLAALWGPWWQRAKPDEPEPPSARQWVEALLQALTGMGVPERLVAWADAADRAGRHQEAQEHRQVWQHVMELLGDLAGLFGDEPLTIETLSEVVDTALAGATLGLTPPTLDQVLVGSIERSRHPAIRAAFVMGFAEGEFPQRPTEDPIFSDRSRAELARRGVELAPSSRQQLFDERMLAYIALTRPSERLWVSWPVVDDEGRVLRPSPWLGNLKAALPQAVLEHRLSDPSSERAMWSITTPADLVAALAADFRLRRGRAEGSADVPCDRRWNALYDFARRHEAIQGSLRSALASLTYRNRAELPSGKMAQVLGDPLRSSVSRIETFASCPFRHFADCLLDLEPRAEWELEAVDLGLICHRVLERYVGQLVAQRQRLDSVAEDEIPSIIRHLSEEATKELVDELLRGDPRNAYILSRGETDLTRVLDAQRFVASAGEFSPCGVEVSFGMPMPSSPSPDQRYLPALPITTPQGRTILLRGRIDRVDLAEAGGRYLAAVIDYKRSLTRRMSLAKAFHGLDLQLLAYLLVIREHGSRLASRPVEPAAAFYVALLGGLRSVDEPPSEPLKPEDRYTSLKPRGIVDWQCVPSLDVIEPGKASKVISAFMKKDGNPGNLHTTDVADHDTFLALLDHADHSMGDLCDRMLDGDVSVSPYCLGTETACRWCLYPSVCRYEFDAQGMRFLPGMNRQQALDRLERCGGGTPHD